MNNKPVKVLYFGDRMLRGGIQSLVIDWVSRFDKEKIKVDFLLLDDGNKYELEDVLKEMGCNVYKLDNIWITNPIDFIKEAKALNTFFKMHHDYKVIHMHSSSKNYLVLKCAKKYNIPIRICHSHNIDFQTCNLFKKVYGNYLKTKVKKYATDYFACSNVAGEWLFGKDNTKNGKVTIIHNAIDYDKFKYNEKIRYKLRTELGFKESDLVVGHVGRFTVQKNHKFLIDIYNELYKKNNNYRLLLIGTGEKENEIKEKVKMYGLEDYVIFAGFKSNVNEYMQAMDLFIFPSLYEGLGLVLIEAQASGLPCFTSSEVVPKEASVSKDLKYVSLNCSANGWSKIILDCDLRRKDNKKLVKTAGYYIDDVINELENFYLRK